MPCSLSCIRSKAIDLVDLTVTLSMLILEVDPVNFIFPSQFPCAFALNLTLSKEALLKNIRNSHASACVKTPTQDPRDASSDQGDEMDTSRTKRRFTLYESSVKDFLNYFSLDDRVVKVDTSAAQVQHIWEAVVDFFAAEMDFTANRVLNTVVLFSFGK